MKCKSISFSDNKLRVVGRGNSVYSQDQYWRKVTWDWVWNGRQVVVTQLPIFLDEIKQDNI